MSLLRHAVSGLRRMFHRETVDEELDDELRHWLDLATRERIAQGLAPEEAAREARLALGGVEVVKERVRSAGWESAVDATIRDVRYALRGLRAAPAYSLVAIVTLGIGIALTTTELTVSNTVLRQHWAVPDPSRVFTIVGARGSAVFSPSAARYFNEHATSFSGIVAVRCLGGMRQECTLTMNDAPVDVDFVTGNYFSVLRLGVSAGRGLVASDDQLDAPRAVAVISDAFWRNRLGKDPAVVGKTVRIDDVAFTIVGVANPDFTGTRTERKDVWLPFSSMLLLRPHGTEARDQLTDPSSNLSESTIAGRLVPGATPEQARAELETLNHQFQTEHRFDDAGIRLIPTTFFPNPAKLRTAASMFALMFVATTLVLLLACANVGNLLLARASVRAREIAVRLALGASRRRVVRQLLTESLLLAIGAGALGITASFVLPSAIMTRAFGNVAWRFVPDVPVISAAICLVAITCIAFGLAPALHATRADVSAVIKSSDGGTGGSVSRVRLRGALLAAQVAISLLLLVNAGLLIRGVQQGRDHDAGFRTRGVTVLTFELPASYDPARNWAFTRRLMDDSRSSGATLAFASDAPLGAGRVAHFRIAGEPAERQRASDVFDISPGLLELLGLPVLAGRDLTASDDESVVLVNRAFAADMWPGENPIGKAIIEPGGIRHVVGVVKDASVSHLGRIQAALFRPLRPGPVPAMLLLSPTPAVTQAIAALATQIDARVQVRVDSIAGNVDRQLGGLQTTAMLAGILGVVALAIAAIGVFGVFAYVVQARTREIGIRTALGASPAWVIALVLRESSTAIGLGLGAGLLVSLATARFIASELYGASAFDPLVFGGTALLLLVAGVIATWIPARRAARVDPVTALRQE